MNQHIFPPGRPAQCPCGGAAPGRPTPAKAPRYEACCGRYIDAGLPAPNAWELMRSRYSAYVLGAPAYLRATWAPHTCPADLDVDPAAPDAPRWLGLQIKRFTALDDTHAEVEFVARYKVDGRAHRLHEASRFTRSEDGRWRYVDGAVTES
ncbi:YchJ family protein [Paraburkholderia jirisanensis]